MASGNLPETPTEVGKLPRSRFKDAGQLRDYCQQMIRADNKRIALRSRVEALFNGFPSYPRGKVSEGFGWFPRVNYRELEGLISTQATPLYDLVTEVDHCIDIELDIEAESTEQRQDWEDAIQKNFTWLLFKKCRQDFNYDFLLQQREMLLHGIGYHVNTSKNWMASTPRAGEILFPDGCPLKFHRKGKAFLLRDFWPGEDVFAAIESEEVAKKRGWVPDNVWKTLVLAQKQYRSGGRMGTAGGNEMLNLQRYLRRGDIGYSNTAQVGLWMNWVYVAEYEGGVSLYAIEETINPGKTASNNGYLFEKRFMEDEFPLTLFPFDIGNGDIESVRGLGMRSKDFFELSNRMKNAMVAQVLISAFPQVKQTVPNIDPDKLKLMRFGAMSIWPYGVEAGMTNFPPLNNSGLALSKELRETLGENLAATQSGAPEPRDRETAYSFSVRAQDAARISNGLQSLYESNLQHFYDRTYRLLIDTPNGKLPHQRLAKEFKERCIRDGVPAAALTKTAIGEIREVTSTGAGSAATRLHNLMQLFQIIYPTTTEEKKITIERDLVSALMGGAKVNRYARSMTDGQIPNQDDAVATLESSSLSSGGNAQVADGQNDVKHVVNHFQQIQQIIQAAQSGQMDLGQAYTAIHKLLDHAGQHLQKLQSNPQRQSEFKQLADQWEEFAQEADRIRQAAQEQEQPSPEQQMSEDGQVKMAKVQQDGAIKERKAQGDMALKARKQQFNETLADAKTAASITRNGATRR